MMWRLSGILDRSIWIRFVRSFREIVLSIMTLFLSSFNLISQNYVFTTVPVYLAAGSYLMIGIHTQNLEQIAYIMPNLSTLQLSFCGRLADSALAAIVSRLHQLEHLILTGPFLITTSAWKSALQTIGHKLHTFEISDTARWDEECSIALVTSCPNLETVALKRINGLSNESIKWLSTLKHLKSLDLTEPAGLITDEEVVPIIQSAGQNLEKLVLDRCVELGDKTLEAIVRNCHHLHTLSLDLLDHITDECVVESFTSWKKNTGLINLNLSRCVGIRDPGVQAILAHSGTTLEILNLNSLDELTQETFKLLTEGESDIGCELVELDVGFVRCVSDDVVYALSRACKELRVLKVVKFYEHC
jgi:DNA repair protein RAD7